MPFIVLKFLLALFGPVIGKIIEVIVNNPRWTFKKNEISFKIKKIKLILKDISFFYFLLILIIYNNL